MQHDFCSGLFGISLQELHPPAPRTEPRRDAPERLGPAGSRSRARLTQTRKLLPGGAGVGVPVVQRVGHEQHPLHLPGERKGRGRWSTAGRGGARGPPAALTPRGSSGCAAGSGPGTPLRAWWSWRPAAGAVGSPCLPVFSARPAPSCPAARSRGGAELSLPLPPPAPARPGPAMLDFAIFAVTFLLILVGAVLYLYPVMAAVPSGPTPSAGSERPRALTARPRPTAPGSSGLLCPPWRRPALPPGPGPAGNVAAACGSAVLTEPGRRDCTPGRGSRASPVPYRCEPS